MIISGAHWFFAMAVAISIHLAGMLWLLLPVPLVKEPKLEPASEGIVVNLEHNSRTSTADVKLVEPEPDPGRASAEIREVLPDQTGPREPEIPDVSAVSGDPILTVMGPEAVDPAKTLEAEPTAAVSDAVTVEPESVDSRVLSEVALPEPETITAQDLSAAPPRPETIEPRQSVATVTVPGASLPVEVVPTPDVRTAPPRSEVEVKRVEPLTDAALVEEAVVASVEQSESIPRSKAIEAKSVEEEKVVGETVTAAAQPALEVERVGDQGISEARPVTIDLQELEDKVGTGGVTARYAGVIKGWLQKNMHYPRAARLAGQEGEVVVRFVIDRGGNVRSITLESRSGYPLLDREAREMIERGNPFPAMPDEMLGQTLEVRVPASFHVRDETLTKEIPPINLE